MMKMKKKTTTKSNSRTNIEQKFVTVEDVILKMSFQDAIISNQRLILDTLLDIRDTVVNKI